MLSEQGITPLNPEEIDAAWNLFEWNGSLRITAKLGDNGVTGGVLKSKAALHRAVLNLEKGHWDIYVGANPARGSRIKAATRDVETWRYLVLDLDPLDPEVPAELAIERLIAQIPVQGCGDASHIVFTGRGAQGWVRLQPYDLRTLAERAEAERGMGAFLHRTKLLWGDTLGYRLDTSTSDLARIVRCPGTINWKTGKRAAIVRRGTVSLDPQFILDCAGPEPPPPEPIVGDCSNLNVIAPHLNDRARRFLRMGVHDGERHKSAYAAAINLRELGVDRYNARMWVRRGGRKCYPHTLKASECDHAVAEAWKGR